MKKVVLYLFIVIMATALSMLLVDSILHEENATIMQALLIANLISISVAITIYAQVSEPGKTVHHFHPGLHPVSPSPVTRDGMIKKGDKLTPEHRAKISASLKKYYSQKKSQKKSGK